MTQGIDRPVRIRPNATRFFTGNLVLWIAALVIIANIGEIFSTAANSRNRRTVAIGRTARLDALRKERAALVEHSNAVINTMPTQQYAALLAKIQELDSEISSLWMEEQRGLIEEPYLAVQDAANDAGHRWRSTFWVLVGFAGCCGGIWLIYQAYPKKPPEPAI